MSTFRHHGRARCEDRLRGAKDTGLTNLPSVIFSEVVDQSDDLGVCDADGVVDAHVPTSYVSREHIPAVLVVFAGHSPSDSRASPEAPDWL